jgi:hypothetical protein
LDEETVDFAGRGIDGGGRFGGLVWALEWVNGQVMGWWSV